MSVSGITDQEKLKGVVSKKKYLHTVDSVDEMMTVVSNLSEQICNDSKGLSTCFVGLIVVWCNARFEKGTVRERF